MLRLDSAYFRCATHQYNVNARLVQQARFALLAFPHQPAARTTLIHTISDGLQLASMDFQGLKATLFLNAPLFGAISYGPLL